MTVFFNVTDAIGESSHHGITRTERQLAAALARRPGVDFVILADGRLRRVDTVDVVGRLHPDEGDGAPVVERYGVDRPPAQRRAANMSFRRVQAARASRVRTRPPTGGTPEIGPGDALVSVGLDWVHGLLDEAERWAFGKDARYFGFCYDLIPIDHPEWLFPPDPLGFDQHFHRVTRVASSVLCISENTRSDFVRHYPDYGAERVQVLRLGADAAVATRAEHDRFAATLFDGEPYAVYCATIDRRKNHQLVYRVAKEMARDGVAGNIAFVGKIGSGVEDLIDSLRHDPGIAGRIAHVSNCEDQYLAAMYKRARFAIYPSLYEGWGLGVTEALAHGTPCIVATGSSLGEAGLGVCLELHPLRTSEWVRAMNRYFDERPVLPVIHIPTWEEAADSLLELVAA
jgi:glycosyltransferase involved in cell wall biosynthesis